MSIKYLELFDDYVPELRNESKIYYRAIYNVEPSGARFDAFRHAYGSAKLTRDYGEGLADTLGTGREPDRYNPFASEFDQAEARRDVYNNAIGREIGLIGGTDKELAQITAHVMNKGDLKIRGKEGSEVSEKEIENKESEVEFFEDKVDDGADLVYDRDGNLGSWVTINGHPVFIEEDDENDNKKSNDGY
jgi:hypothetical protein